MSPILMAWFSAFGYGLEAIAGKLSSKYSIRNPWQFNFYWSLAVLIFTAVIAGPANIMSLPSDWTTILIAGIFYAAAGIFYILSIYTLDISVLSPLFSFRSAFSTIIGLFILHESLTPVQLTALGVIFIAGFFASYEEKLSLKTFFRPDIGLAMILMAALAVYGFAVNRAMAVNSFWQVTFWVALIAQILLLPTIPLFIRDLKTTPLSSYRGALFMAVFGTIATLAANLAFAGSVSITAAIMTIPFSMILAIIIARWKPSLLESHTKKTYTVRLIAAGIMFICGLVLT